MHRLYAIRKSPFFFRLTNKKAIDHRAVIRIERLAAFFVKPPFLLRSCRPGSVAEGCVDLLQRFLRVVYPFIAIAGGRFQLIGGGVSVILEMLRLPGGVIVVVLKPIVGYPCSVEPDECGFGDLFFDAGEFLISFYYLVGTFPSIVFPYVGSCQLLQSRRKRLLSRFAGTGSGGRIDCPDRGTSGIDHVVINGYFRQKGINIEGQDRIQRTRRCGTQGWGEKYKE